MDTDEVRRLTERAIALAGTGIAIFTFDLIFLYPLYRSGEVDAVLFQATLMCIVSAISFFSFSTLYLYVLPGQNDNNRRWVLFRKGNLFFLLALLLLTAVPFLILFTIRLDIVGLIALLLYVAFLFEDIRMNRRMPFLNSASGSN